jgi:hypothetical protein
MKKVTIFVIVLLLLSSVYAFDKDTINAGGGFSYVSGKSDADADTESNLILLLRGGYFMKDNLTLDLHFQYQSTSSGESDKSLLGFGIGGRYFMQDKFYVGPSFLYLNDVDNDYSTTMNYLLFQAGYLHPLKENVYLDVGVDYQMGIGEYGGDTSGDNEQTLFYIRAGLEFFFMNHKK